MRPYLVYLACVLLTAGLLRPTPADAASNLDSAAEAFAQARALAGAAGDVRSPAQWAEIARLYRRAADRGHRLASAELGYLLLTAPEGAVANQAQPRASGRARLEREIAFGNVDAMVLLGYALEHGYGVPAAPAQARGLYERAAAAGSTGAMQRLAEISDPVEALDWWRRAAAAGEPQAMLQLGVALRDGQAVAADRTQARRWLDQAVEAGAPGALAELARLNALEDALAREREQLATALAQSKADAQGQREALDQTTQALAQVREEAQAQRTQLQRLQSDGAAAQARALRLADELEAARAAMSAFEERAHQAREAADAAVARLEDELRTAREAGMALQRLEAMEEELTQARRRGEDLAAQLAQEQAAREDAQAQLASVIEQLHAETLSPEPPSTQDADAPGLVGQDRFEVARTLRSEGREEEAMVWLRAAAQAGHAQAQEELDLAEAAFFREYLARVASGQGAPE